MHCFASQSHISNPIYNITNKLILKLNSSQLSSRRVRVGVNSLVPRGGHNDYNLYNLIYNIT